MGRDADVIRRQTPALLYDHRWNDDIVSCRTDGQRSPKYIHTTNYPNRLLMRRAKSVNSLHSLNGSGNASPSYYHSGRYNGATSAAPDQMAPRTALRTFDRQTQTTVDRYTQTPPHECTSTYYQQLMSSLNNSRSQSSAGFAPTVKPGDVRQLESFVLKHGPAMYRDGGKGAPWRHLKMTCGVSGENIMFVDGAIKEYDSRFFPLPSARRRELEVPEVYFRRPMSVTQY